jgi:lon-related putative ATP-dependent protease
MASFRKELAQHDQAAVGVLTKTVLDDVRHSFPRDRVAQFLDGVTEYILNNLEDYVRVNSARLAGPLDDATEDTTRTLDRMLSVNLILDNYDQKEAPIVVETLPSYASLFGMIERRLDARGFTHSDFSQIKVGSLLRADGGYLVMNAMDVLTDHGLWSALKKVLLYGRLDIQPLDMQTQLNALKPDFIKVNVKVILLGDPAIYLALWAAEEDFHKMFKVHAEFVDQTDRTPQMILNYAAFFAQMARDENLLHCDRSGAAALVEWAVAYTDSQDKITLQFSYVADLLREAEHYARASGANLVSRTHVRKALEQRRWRSNSVDERLREQIAKGVLLIDVTGARVGQINGLTIYESGIMAYGKPSRITATVSAGNAGIINIEREVALSGAIHNKGVLILSGLLRSIFSRSQPMSFTASIAFEQSYGGVDGDSASAAEIIALLSAISNVPVRQDLAITGSINQKGDIQPIGGVNEKALGFFEVCQDRGLTGSHGVVLPRQNVRDLMLREDVVEAVRRNRFYLYPVTRLEEAIELMMGLPAGTLDPSGQFSEHSVYGKVKQNLDVLHEASKHLR